MPVGTYTVTEEDPGPLYELASIACSTSEGSDVSFTDPPRSVTIDLADDGHVGCTFTNVDLGPQLQMDPAMQNVQYSDLIQPLTLTAVDDTEAVLAATFSWSADGSSFMPGLPAGLSSTAQSCTTVDRVQTCQWLVDGAMSEAEGTYTIRTTVDDGRGKSEVIDATIVVSPEEAAVSFADDSPVAVPVTEPGSDSSEPFTVLVEVQEAAESGASAAPGDINLAEVLLTLESITSGLAHSVDCREPNPAAPNDYGAVLAVECDFSALPVDAYHATATVSGGYYHGKGEDALVVYDPSLGFTTGGGHFLWPGTSDRTTFAYTMKYNKRGNSLKGDLLLIRHLPDGTMARIKSNALDALTLDEATDSVSGASYGWAFFTGKATYLAPDHEEPIGNHEFAVYVEDRAEPGVYADRFWVEVRDRDGLSVDLLSLAQDPPDNAVSLSGGNLVVPHQNEGKGKDK